MRARFVARGEPHPHTANGAGNGLAWHAATCRDSSLDWRPDVDEGVWRSDLISREATLADRPGDFVERVAT